MHISWRTASENCPSEVVFQQVSKTAAEAGSRTATTTSSSSIWRVWQQARSTVQDHANRAVGFTYLLSEREMCDAPADTNPFAWHLHRATMTGLVPSASYRYRIEGGEGEGDFTAAPEPSPDASFTFIGFGDMGDARHAAAKSPGAAFTLPRLRQEVEDPLQPVQLILHVGDLSYANGNPKIWDSFFDDLQPISSRVPYMVAVGNHEYGYSAHRDSSKGLPDVSGEAAPYQPSWGNYGPDSSGECGVVTARRFHMPRYKGKGHGPWNVRDNPPFWYSFDYGSVHFTVISTEHSLADTSRQYAWLEADLASVDRCVTPWLVLLLHRPMYVVYPHKSNREVGEHLRQELEPLLLQHRVDLTIAGHVHSYYRSCAVRFSHCVDDWAQPAAGPATGVAAGGQPSNAASSNGGAAAAGGDGWHGITHFVIGSAGRKLSKVKRDQQDWCAASVQEWGYGRFTVKGGHSLLAEFVSSESGQVLDSVVVKGSGAGREGECGVGGSVAKAR